MDLKLEKIINSNIKPDELKITVECNKYTMDVKNIIDYINNYNHKIAVNDGYETRIINYNDIILFYSEKKNNYCKTISGIYKIQSKLYQLEQIDNFIRISKRCIVNINYVKCFDMGQTGKIIVKLFDGTEEIVSRRRIKNVLDFLDKRRV